MIFEVTIKLLAELSIDGALGMTIKRKRSCLNGFYLSLRSIMTRIISEVIIQLLTELSIDGALGMTIKRKRSCLNGFYLSLRSIMTRIISEVIIQLLAELSIDGALNDDHKRKLFEQAFLPIVRKYCGPYHLQFATIIVDLINAYGALGDHKKQKELLERALSIIRNIRPRPS